MIEFIEVMFRALTGLKLTFPTIISLAVFFAAGYYFAATMKRIGPLKMILVLFLAYLLNTLLSGLLGVYTLAVVLGFISNQGVFLTRVLIWAENLAEFLFVMHHRAAYEDIRREESTGQGHSQDDAQRASANQKKAQGGSGTGPQSRSTSGGGSGARSHSDTWQPDPGKSQADINRCLKILELEPKLKLGEIYTQKEIKKAYRRLAMIHHPDMPTGNHEAFVQLGAAMEYLVKHLAT